MGAGSGWEFRRGAIQRSHNLAPHVDSRVVVVAELRRAHAETCEHDRAFDFGIARKRVAPHHVILVDNQGPGGCVVPQGQRTLVLQKFNLAEVNVLKVCPVYSRRP